MDDPETAGATFQIRSTLAMSTLLHDGYLEVPDWSPRPPDRTLIRVVVADFELVVAGVRAMLQPFAAQVEVLDLHDVPTGRVDVVLHDPVGGFVPDTAEWAALEGVTLVVFTWQIRHPKHGRLSKSMSADDLVLALVDPAFAVRDGPVGSRAGLTPREAEMVDGVTRGLTNAEIARAVYLSINSVKSHIRTAYRKMGVTRRSEAVLWGVEHGFPRAAEPAASRSRTAGT